MRKSGSAMTIIGELDIRACSENDSADIHAIINDGARAYRGVIPADRWHEPYMSADALTREIADGVHFWAALHEGRMLGVMGVQDKGDVALVRHAYVKTIARRQGVCSALLRFIQARTGKPILIGTWRDASWAISFYEKHGYRIQSPGATRRLLGHFWRDR